MLGRFFVALAMRPGAFIRIGAEQPMVPVGPNTAA